MNRRVVSEGPLVRLCGALVWLVAVVAVVGWTTGRHGLTSWEPGTAGMKLTTAVALAVGGGALVAGRRARARAGACLVLLAGGSLLEYLVGAGSGLDELFVDDPYPSSYPGRMSVFTGLTLVLIGIALLTGDGRWRRVAPWCGAGALLLGASATLGRLLGAPVLYGAFLGSSPVAIPTGVCLVVLSAGVVLVHGDFGATRLLHDGSEAGGLARQGLLAGAVLPLLLTLGLYELTVFVDLAPGYAPALSSLLSAAVTCFVIIRIAARVAVARGEAELARERAEQASLAKTELLSRVSHELRTPMNAILGFGQLLAADDRVPRDSARHIVEAGEHLLALIDDVLDTASIESGRFRFVVTEVAVHEAVPAAAAVVRAGSARSDVTVTWDGPACVVTADARRLRQILLNLVSNAFKYNRPGGAVHLRWYVEDEHVVLEVSDEGRGLDAAAREQVFEPFARLGAERTGVPGTGLGLTVSRHLARQMGGELSLVDGGSGSSPPGEAAGAVFRLVLPRGKTGATDVDATSLAESGVDRRPVVLVLDGRPVERQLMARACRRIPDLVVLEASDHASARAALETALPHVVLCGAADFGPRTVELLGGGGTRVVFVVVTSNPSDDHRQSLVDEGADHVILEPLALAALLDVVTALTRARPVLSRAD